MRSPIDKRWLLSRRAVLGSLAVAGVSPLLGVSRSASAATVAPKRFVVVHVPEGMWKEVQRPTATSLGPVFSPLENFKSKILFLNNLNMASRDFGPGGDGHHRGVPHMLTGTEMLNVSQAGGASVDQQIAERIRDPSSRKSLHLAVRIRYGDTNSRCIWSGPGQVVLPEESPYNAYKTVFANGVPTGPSAPKVDLRKSALDYSLQETNALKARLAVDDRQKLESYHQSLREIEKRLAALPPDVGAGVCVKPNQGTPYSDVEAMEVYPQVGQLQMDLLVSALQCDLTRVATLHWGNSNDQCTYPWLDINALGHDLSHNSVGEAAAKKLKVYNWYAQQFAYLLNKLELAKEGTGSMLDNTVVLWVSEFSDSNAHAADKLLWTLMGNVGGYFRSGRVVDCGGRSVNDLHTTLCNAFGLNMAKFGNPDYCNGPIVELT